MEHPHPQCSDQWPDRAWQDSLLSTEWMSCRDMKRQGSPDTRPYSMRALRPSASEHAILMFLQASPRRGMTFRPSMAYSVRWNCKAPQSP